MTNTTCDYGKCQNAATEYGLCAYHVAEFDAQEARLVMMEIMGE